MRKLKVEPMPCYKCGNVPHFVPLPTEEFPTAYEMFCSCKTKTKLRYEFGYKSKSAKGFVTRRASINNAIRLWNRYVKKYKQRKQGFYEDIYVTCKFCKQDNLTWGKRPYKNKWRGGSSYVLYERVPFEEACQLTGMTRIEFVIHNCLSKKNIVKVEYTQA